ncbi:T9SS type A sorting domain-containing protein [Paracrocinitomix mangrovi]|uniref:T9SS type A sorting domain-containing protein n=1 Tax=Paracrocinitomix mangrovi TaxID=2862509 RepID=UPI001C8D43FC|nr:T9SS type A sorting domain-containing protein [Paracrocinitomix mangrovi]UKN00702.1 T9SS type A sorting domain-containing protein [Paracrocinitomix mangrovi]
MKKLILLFILLISINSFSQVFDTLLPNAGGYWGMKFWVYDGWSLSGKIYSNGSYEIYNTELDVDGNTWNYANINGTSGLIRSDSGKVIFRNHYGPNWLLDSDYQDTLEHVLYDFNMLVDDTAYFDQGWPITVESIGTANVLGVTKNAWFLSNNDTIVQGLGSMQGLMRPFKSTFESGQIMCSFIGTFIDTVNQDTVTLTYDNPSTCETLDLPNLEESISIKYLPALATLSVQNAANLTAKLYGIDGKLIGSFLIQNANYNYSMDNFNSGIYILQIGDSYSQQFVKY